jgi:hypothetical protein
VPNKTIELYQLGGVSMAEVVKLSDGMKYMFLKSADHKCQCNVGHVCMTRVNRLSYFVAESDPKAQVSKSHTVQAKVLCKGCIDKGHHRRLVFSPSDPAVKVRAGIGSSKFLTWA